MQEKTDRPSCYRNSGQSWWWDRRYLLSAPFAFLYVALLPFLILAWIGLWLYTRGKTNRSDWRVHLLVFGVFIILGTLNFGWQVWGEVKHSQHPRAAKAVADMRSVATAIEIYFMDHNAYPPASDAKGNPVPPDISGVSAGNIPRLLTTPVAYLTYLPTDPFHEREYREFGPYRYATDCQGCWIIASNGPDRMPTVRIEDYIVKAGCAAKNFVSHLGTGTAIVYDPTNGIRPEGDILWAGPKDGRL